MENSPSHVPKGLMQAGQRPQFQGLRGPPGSLNQQALVAAAQQQRPGLQPGQQNQHSSMGQSPHQAAPQGQQMVQPHPGLYSSVRPMYNQSQQTGFPHHLQHQSASSPRTVGLPVTGPGQSGGHPSMLSMQSAQGPMPSSQQAALQAARMKANQGIPTQVPSGSSAYGVQSMGGVGQGSVSMQQFGGPSNLSQQSLQQQQQQQQLQQQHQQQQPQWSNHLKQSNQQSVPSPSYASQYMQQRPPHGQSGQQQQAQQHQSSQLQPGSQTANFSESQSQSLSQPPPSQMQQSQSQPQGSQSHPQFQPGPQSLQQQQQQQPRMQTAAAAKPATFTPMTPVGAPSSAAPNPERRILGKRSLQELVQTIDQNERLDPDVEDVMLEFADHFIETVTLFACELAKHRKSDTLEAKDVLLNLERNWQITIPGFGGDEYKAYKRPMVIDVHKQRLAIVRRSQASGQPATEAGTNRSGAQISNSTMVGKIYQNGQTAPSGPP